MPAKKTSPSTPVLPSKTTKTSSRSAKAGSTSTKKSAAKSTKTSSSAAKKSTTAKRATSAKRTQATPAKKSARSAVSGKKVKAGSVGLTETHQRHGHSAPTVTGIPSPTVRIFELRDLAATRKGGLPPSSAYQQRTVAELARVQREALKAMPVGRQIDPLGQIAPTLGALRRSVELVVNEVDFSSLKDLRKLLKNASGATLSIGSRSVALPSDLVAVLSRMVESLERGSELTMIEGSVSPEETTSGDLAVPVDLDQEITSQETADILNVSRPYVIKLAKQGVLPPKMVGNRHRFRLGDVLAHDQQMSVARDAALREIAPEGAYTAEDF